MQRGVPVADSTSDEVKSQPPVTSITEIRNIQYFYCVRDYIANQEHEGCKEGPLRPK